MRILKVISFALLMTISVVHQVQAVGIIAGRTIVGIGCADDGVCFINLSGYTWRVYIKSSSMGRDFF